MATPKRYDRIAFVASASTEAQAALAELEARLRDGIRHCGLHGPDVYERLIRIDGPNCLTQSWNDCGRFGRRAHEQRHVVQWRLRRGKVVSRFSFCLQTSGLHIAHDADDFKRRESLLSPDPDRWTWSDTTTDRIFIRKVMPDERFVDDHDAGRAQRPTEQCGGGPCYAVHPSDPRYANLVGKKVCLPLTDRTIPVIADEYPDPEKGSGAVKITPGHDFNHFDVGLKYRYFDAGTIKDDLKAIPSFSIVTDLDNLFDPATGIVYMTEDHTQVSGKRPPG